MSYRARNVGRYLTRSAMLTFALAIALSPLASLLPPNTLLRVTEKMSSASTRASSLLAEAAPLTGHMPQLLSAPAPDGTFATRLYTDANGNRMTYYLYGPANFSPTGSYPLVLILHGGGEGAKPSVRAAQNRTNLIDQPYVKAFTSGAVQDYWPSFVVAPQAPEGQQWVDVPATVSEYTLAPQPSEWLALAIGIVQLLQQTYAQINPNRIYVVGISMGGIGAWEAAERWPSIFAAALPISGAGDPQAASTLVHVPVWALHGTLDDVVPVQGSRLMVAALRADGGEACYTEFPDGSHNIWTQHNLENPQLLSWLFSQTKAPNNASPPQTCPPDGGSP